MTADDDVTAMLDFDRASLWHPYTSMRDPLPVQLVRSASGVRLRLEDGRTLVDGMSSWWAAIHGYGHPTLDAAVRAQLEQMSHVMFGGLTHAPAVALGRRLLGMAPDGMSRVFFADSGSVSVEVALKMALQYQRAVGQPERTRILSLRGGYHGDTFAAMSVCDPVGGMHHMFARAMPEQLFAPLPGPDFGAAFDSSSIDALGALLGEHAQAVAAVIVEPVVQGAGGMRFYHPEYLRRLRGLCDAHGALLICDEIATGFGRSGTLWGVDHAGICPDIMCVGKALTGGYMTLAATLVTDRVAEGISAGEAGGTLMHGPTFMANPLACAVANASLGLLADGRWRGRVAALEAQLRAELEPARGLASVSDVRVLGAIGVVELARPVDMARAQTFFVERGVWVRPFGKLVYLMPPYVTSADELSELTAAVVAWARSS